MHHFKNIEFSSANFNFANIESCLEILTPFTLIFETLADVQNTFLQIHFLPKNKVSRGENQFIQFFNYTEWNEVIAHPRVTKWQIYPIESVINLVTHFLRLLHDTTSFVVTHCQSNKNKDLGHRFSVNVSFSKQSSKICF